MEVITSTNGSGQFEHFLENPGSGVLSKYSNSILSHSPYHYISHCTVSLLGIDSYRLYNSYSVDSM